MTAMFPNGVVSLVSVVNGDPVRSKHFNQIFEEVAAIEAVLGADGIQKRTIARDRTDVKTRLAAEMTSAGNWVNEFAFDETEDDEIESNYGIRAGSVRQVHLQALHNAKVGATHFHIEYPPGMFQGAPLLLAARMVNSSYGTDWYPNYIQTYTATISEQGARVESRNISGFASSPWVHRAVAISIGQLDKYERGQPWKAFPRRAGLEE